jgi:hypothetical protein
MEQADNDLKLCAKRNLSSLLRYFSHNDKKVTNTQGKYFHSKRGTRAWKGRISVKQNKNLLGQTLNPNAPCLACRAHEGMM